MLMRWGGDKDEDEKKCVNRGGGGKKVYCDFVFDLSNLNELFEINILEICLEMFFYFFFYNFYFIFLFLFVDNGIS